MPSDLRQWVGMRSDERISQSSDLWDTAWNEEIRSVRIRDRKHPISENVQVSQRRFIHSLLHFAICSLFNISLKFLIFSQIFPCGNTSHFQLQLTMLAAQNIPYEKEEVLPVHTSVLQVDDGELFLVYREHGTIYQLTVSESLVTCKHRSSVYLTLLIFAVSLNNCEGLSHCPFIHLLKTEIFFKSINLFRNDLLLQEQWTPSPAHQVGVSYTFSSIFSQLCFIHSEMHCKRANTPSVHR